MKKQQFWISGLVAMSLFIPVLRAEDGESDAAEGGRDATSAQAAAEADMKGELPPDAEPEAPPRKLPDLTKGEPFPGKPALWNIGATGIIGAQNGGVKGDQVQVKSVLPGSPADGKVLPGDVILGIQGQDFVAGGHLGYLVGNALIKAEEEAGRGLFKIHIWRDRNWPKRGLSEDVVGVNMESIVAQAERDAELYEWKGEETEKKESKKGKSAKTASPSDIPVDGLHTNFTLQLKVMGTYSDTSPWDCPVAEKIREDAYKAIARDFQRKGGWRGVLALVASGKPEYRQIARDWVHSQKLIQDMNVEVPFNTTRAKMSWIMGFGALEVAIYYDATGDDYVLPYVRYNAIQTALGQGGGGAWGHGFCSPNVNGGELHGRLPGYGALNAAGSRCFFLLALAKKAGIKDPEIDAAIDRSSRFFGEFVDKGALPYGEHPPARTDDSNGKNYGAAYAFYALGKTYEAKYFGMTSAHAAFTRRGGHGSPVQWYYTPSSANLCGPRAVAASMRNMRWFYTLARRHDGTFVYQGGNGIGGKGMGSPTETHALYYSAPLQQLIITGKDANKECWLTDQEYQDLLVATIPQMNDPKLIKEAGITRFERSTDETILLLGHFYPQLRGAIAHNLGQRFAAGEKDIPGKVLPLLASDKPRIRDGACQTLIACGTDVLKDNLAKLTPLLQDPAEVVRMSAVRAVAQATQGSERDLMLLQAATEDYPGMGLGNANVRTVVKGTIFGSGKRGTKKDLPLLAVEPFSAGYDANLVRRAMENLITMDPGGQGSSSWNKSTILQLAGPLLYVAETPQLSDKMFGGARLGMGQQFLKAYGCRELTEVSAVSLIKRHRLDRDTRRQVTFGNPSFISMNAVKAAPGKYRFALDLLYEWLQDDPLFKQGVVGQPHAGTHLYTAIKLIENAPAIEPLPSLVADAENAFRSEVKATGNASAQLAHCRAELADPKRKNALRQMAALSILTEQGGPDAIRDVAPYLGHAYWRVSEHAFRQAVILAKAGAAGQLVELLAKAEGKQAAQMLLVLAAAEAKPALASARLALKNTDPEVRAAAVQAVYAIGGNAEIATVLDFMRQAKRPKEFFGCESAFLSYRQDASRVERAGRELRDFLQTAKSLPLKTAAYILGQFGGAENLDAIRKAAVKTKNDDDLAMLAESLAFSPDHAASQVMLDVAKTDKYCAAAMASKSVHRMVGRNGPRDFTDTERLDFAIPMLDIKHDKKLISYLRRIHTGRSVKALMAVMKKGSTEVSAESVVECIEGMERPTAEDSAAASEALTEVIQYIEVTHLRGGAENRGDQYPYWKALQARAGRGLLRFHKEVKAPVPTFDNRDLDL